MARVCALVMGLVLLMATPGLAAADTRSATNQKAVETVIASLGDDSSALVAETADLLYHLLVVLHMRGVALDDVMAELQGRTGQTGLQEKAARTAE